MALFEIGDKVVLERSDGTKIRGILKYLGFQFVVVQNHTGIEEVCDIENWTIKQDCRPYILDLGDDLVSAIENAAWTDDGGHGYPNLQQPTPHMQSAIINWKEATKGGLK